MTCAVQPCGHLWFSNLQFPPHPLCYSTVSPGRRWIWCGTMIKSFLPQGDLNDRGGESQRERGRGDERGQGGECLHWTFVMVHSENIHLSPSCLHAAVVSARRLVAFRDCTWRDKYQTPHRSNRRHVDDHRRVWCIWRGLCLSVPPVPQHTGPTSSHCMFNHLLQPGPLVRPSAPSWQWRMPAISLDTVQLW